ncbi:LpxD N-terminal domain-containing protein [Microbacterium sp. NPDC089696]|uniref:LpxD N-terminal domain-containing protein n=1 Tax=Microbacterium sp. NPDC089696 TaxID=3364199 RepID=UPI00380D7853
MSASVVTASALAAEMSSVLVGDDRDVTGLAPLGEAGSAQLTFVVDPVKYGEAFGRALAAGAVVLVPAAAEVDDARGTMIPVENPRAAFALIVAAHFARRPEPGIADTARVHPTAEIHPTAHIGEYTVVRAGARVAEHSEVRDHVVIGHDVAIGAHALIKSHAVIGEEGFGMEKDERGDNIRIPHLGSVVIDDHVEVGNFTTVCSGTISPTRVGDHTKIDDHVHIAHNCRIGRNVIITACAEISGSVVIEDETWIGPNASVIQGVTLGRHSLLGIGAVALKSVPADEVRVGNPAKRLGDNPR